MWTSPSEIFRLDQTEWAEVNTIGASVLKNSREVHPVSTTDKLSLSKNGIWRLPLRVAAISFFLGTFPGFLAASTKLLSSNLNSWRSSHPFELSTPLGDVLFLRPYIPFLIRCFLLLARRLFLCGEDWEGLPFIFVFGIGCAIFIFLILKPAFVLFA